jgi:hypothetical protein
VRAFSRPPGYRPLQRHTQRCYLWRNLRWYTYPRLTLAGGVGVEVLELAKHAAGYDVP